MKLETENVQESEASAELIRELMADDAKRGNWLILMHDDDEEAFMQIAFDDHPDGIDLEYRTKSLLFFVLINASLVSESKHHFKIRKFFSKIR